MALAVTHTFNATAGDTPGAAAAGKVVASHWNATHTLAGIATSDQGGTGNGFTKFTGPTTAEKTFTLPDANATLLYSGGALGTPSSGTLTNCTGLPIAGTTGYGTGVATALAVNVGSAGAFVTFNGALGTPSSGTLTSCTGLPAAGVVGTAAVLGANTFTASQTITGTGILLKIGGTTSSFPGLNNSGTTLQCGLADNSDFAPFKAASFLSAAASGGNSLSMASNTRILWTSNLLLNSDAASLLKVTNAADSAYADVKLRNLLTAGGNGSYVQTPSMTVTNLASAATAGAGARAFVTDATATTYLSTVAGGGANKVPVVSNGTNWLIG